MPAVTTFFDKAKTLVGYSAAIAAFTYAIGYFCNVMHFRMLGVTPEVDFSNERVIYHGVMFWVLTPLSWVSALVSVSLLGTMSWIALLILVLAPRWWWGQCSTGGWAPSCLAWCRKKGKALHDSGFVRVLHRLGCWQFLIRPLLRYLPLVLLTLVMAFSFGLSGVIFKQTDLLVAEAAETDDTAARVFEWLTGYPSDLRQLLAKDGGPPCVYGCLSLFAVVCTLSWGGLFRHRIPDWRPPAGAPKVGGPGQLLFIVSGFLLAVQLLLVVALYGFLMASNRYPVIEVRVPALAGEAERGELPPPPHGERLLIIGKRGTSLVVYSKCSKQLRWIDESKLLSAIQREPENLFTDAGPQRERSSGR